MIRPTLMILALAALTASAVSAHKGHPHAIMGTIAAIHDSHLDVQTKEGKKVSVTLNDRTSILRAKTKVSRAELKEGVRVVIQPVSDEGPVVAKSVTLGAAANTVASKKPATRPKK